jgi:type III pantothenate kinase
MNLCIDQGNSSTKIGVFKGDEMIFSSQIPQPDFMGISDLFQQYDIRSTILSSVTNSSEELEGFLNKKCERFISLSHETPLPVINLYKTPETLGKDRLAAVTGAVSLMPGNDLLVIDAGTAITYDFVNALGVYHGGNIAPGINLRLKSLFEFTQNLPLVEAETGVDFMGNDTRSAIQSGVLYGIVFEIDGYIERLMLKYPKLSVFLTGGSSFYFENKLKNRIFANENLVLIGLNRILQYNVQ